jgi:hypothetical protein
MKKTTKQILALLKVNSLKLILKRNKATNVWKRYYFTLDANNPEIHQL